MMKLEKLLSVSFLLLILAKLGIFKILKVFVILLFGLSMSSLISRDIPFEQRNWQPEHEDPWVSGESAFRIIWHGKE
jgi:hypothetical protein